MTTLTVLNHQPREPQRLTDPESLEIVGTPWPTVQGEGPFAGRPAVFVRLAGCNLQCPMCDTNYTSDRTFCRIDDLVTTVVRMGTVNDKRRLVVLTGGEPFRQPVSEFIVKLVGEGFHVQVETNGSVWPADFPSWIVGGDMLHVVLSPKLDNVVPEAWKWAKSVKYVIKDGMVAADGLPTGVLGYRKTPSRPPAGWPGRVFVQPEDDQDERLNEANRRAAVNSAMRFNYTVSLQLHKQLGLP